MKHVGSNVWTRRPAPQTSCPRFGAGAVKSGLRPDQLRAKQASEGISGKRTIKRSSGALGTGTRRDLRGHKTRLRPWRERSPTSGSPRREPPRPTRVLEPQKVWTTHLEADTLNGCGSFWGRQGTTHSGRATRGKCPIRCPLGRRREFGPKAKAVDRARFAFQEGDPSGAPQEIR